MKAVDTICWFVATMLLIAGLVFTMAYFQHLEGRVDKLEQAPKVATEVTR